MIDGPAGGPGYELAPSPVARRSSRSALLVAAVACLIVGGAVVAAIAGGFGHGSRSGADRRGDAGGTDIGESRAVRRCRRVPGARRRRPAPVGHLPRPRGRALSESRHGGGRGYRRPDPHRAVIRRCVEHHLVRQHLRLPTEPPRRSSSGRQCRRCVPRRRHALDQRHRGGSWPRRWSRRPPARGLGHPVADGRLS